MRFWLLKSEPNKYSWDDLKKDKNQTTSWEGVRNYQARNSLRDDCKEGDLVFFYHSRVEPQAIMGVAKVVRSGYPDHFAFQPDHMYFDPKSKQENPTWYMVDIKRIADFDPPFTLAEAKEMPGLENMTLVQRGSRLSVQPVSEDEFKLIVKLRGLDFNSLLKK